MAVDTSAYSLSWEDRPANGFTSLNARERMVKRLQERIPSSQGMEEALAVMKIIPRHFFIEEVWHQYAYKIEHMVSLPLGLKQTISQPMTVARMSGWLCDHAKRESVLEIGTGSGYQCSILSQLFNEVCTIERLQFLQMKAEKVLNSLQIKNVEYHYGDGFLGWPIQRQFDAIIVTAAPESFPSSLLPFLKTNGVLITPVGENDNQRLIGYKARTGQRPEIDDICSVSFVPMIKGCKSA